MPLRPFAPSDNEAGRPDAAAALAHLLKHDAAPLPEDVAAFVDTYLAHRDAQDSDALRAVDERVLLAVLARGHLTSAPRAVGCARVFVRRSPALCTAVIREALTPQLIDDLAARAPQLARHLDENSAATLAFLATCDTRIATALASGADAPLLAAAAEAGANLLVEALARAHLPDAAPLVEEAPARRPPPPRKKAEDLMARITDGVESVKGILGDVYGDGYLAACLAALDLNAGRVVEALLDGKPPQAVSHLSPQLAKISVVSGDSRRTGDVDERAAKRAQKARVRALEKREAEDARLRDAVYDDDYDDRYDGVQEPTVFTGDQDAVRRANDLVRADEDEERFWASQGNNNAGRSAAPAPAKKKELTAKEVALQRRRKTKNKGARHHQRDRAARKV